MIAALILATTAPQFFVGDLKVYGDWVVACDNGRDCHATSLPIEEGPEEPLGDGNITIAIKRSGNPYEPVSVSFAAAGAGPVEEMQFLDNQMRTTRWIAVDRRKLDIRLKTGTIVYDLDAKASAKLIAAMRGKSTVSLLDQRGQPFATVSLRGLAQVFEHIDQQQYLSGTISALAGRGKKPVNSFTVPLMVPRLRIRVAPKPDLPSVTLADERLAQLRTLDPCLNSSGDVTPDAPTYHRLDALNTLMILPTRCGGYNPYRMLYIVDNKGRAQTAQFWPYPGNEMKEYPDLPDVGWDEKARLLNSFGRGRVIADCGESQDYAWYEGRFKLVSDKRMYPCRGSTDYVTTYRIEVDIDDSAKRNP